MEAWPERVPHQAVGQTACRNFNKYCRAARAALAPFPEAMMIRLPNASVTSPAAKIPGCEVEQSGLIMISHRLLSFTRGAAREELGSRPTAMNTPLVNR